VLKTHTRLPINSVMTRLRSTDAKRSRRFLLVGVVAAAAAGLLPAESGLPLAQLIGIVCLITFFRAIRHSDAPDLRPFRLIATGGVSFILGNVVRVIHGSIVGVDNPFPSPADLLFYIGYVLVLCGTVGLVRRRSADVEGDNMIDATIVMTCVGVLALAFVIMPFVHAGAGLFDTSLNVGYSLFDLAIIGVTVRLAVGSGRRNPSYYLLGGTVAGILITDLLLTLQLLGDSSERVLSVSFTLAFVCFAAAGLHPSIARLTDRPAMRDIQLTSRRMVLLGSALLGMPILMALTAALGETESAKIIGVGSLVVAFLVLMRLAVLVQAKERKAAREAILREASARFALATTTDEMWVEAAHHLARLLPGSSTWIVQDEGDLAVVSAGGIMRSDSEVHTILTTATALEPADTCATTELDDELLLASRLSVRGRPESLLVAATSSLAGSETLRAVDLLAQQLRGAAEGLLLAEELHRRKQERRFRALVEHSAELVTVLDEKGIITFASSAARSLLGIDESTLIGKSAFTGIHPDDERNATALLEKASHRSADGTGRMLEPVEVRFSDGTGWRWFEVHIENLLEQEEVSGIVVHSRDVSDRHSARDELEAREARFRSLVQNTSDLIAIVDSDLRFTYVSPSSKRMLGYDAVDLLGCPLADVLLPDGLLRGSEFVTGTIEAPIRDANHEWREVELSITDLRNDPAVNGIVLNARDITERKTLEGELRHLAMHDPLTGLANRNLFKEALEESMRSPRPAAILFLDIDDFKSINDSLGHTNGDHALRELARRISLSLREGDLAARVGGDEFAVLLHGVTDRDVPLEVGDRLLASLREPIDIADARVQVTVSLGAAISEPNSTSEALMRNADIAMYLSKSHGKDGRTLFDPSMLASFNESMELRRDLDRAIERDELNILYQPVYDLESGRMTGVEALLRWHHAERGVISPVQFIPLAEESGEIVPIGAWVLERACRQLATWLREGADPDMTMSVNLSIVQLESEGLLEKIISILAITGLDPSRLTLEVTESVLAADMELVRTRLIELKAMGIHLALDDFGTGYSSLGYLRHFDLDVLKIDRTFLLGTGDLDQQEAILRAIIDLATSRGMVTVAEGVEDMGHVDMLRRVGCSSAQGFLFARPLPASEVLGAADRAAILADHRPTPV
jgi:diguanylate cyclase (GGDEF)-like protein/PAS domain S-box-containing protein